MSIDRVAPQSVEAEQSVLGSILIDPEAILKVATSCTGPISTGPSTRTSTRPCWRSIQREPIDLVTLGDELTRTMRQEVGGPAYLAT